MCVFYCGEEDEDQVDYEAIEQQTNMAAWLVAVSPSSSLSVLEAERKGVTLLCVCVFLPQRERQRVSALVLPNSPQLSQMKLRLFCRTIRISKTHKSRTRKTSSREKRAEIRALQGFDDLILVNFYQDIIPLVSLDEKNGSSTKQSSA